MTDQEFKALVFVLKKLSDDSPLPELTGEFLHGYIVGFADRKGIPLPEIDISCELAEKCRAAIEQMDYTEFERLLREAAGLTWG